MTKTGNSHILKIVFIISKMHISSLFRLSYFHIRISFGFLGPLIILPLLFTLPPFSYADTIHLKDGTILEPKRSWEKNGKLMFYMEDQVTSIPKDDVVQTDKTHSDQEVTLRLKKTLDNDFGIFDGFRDLAWGSKLSDITGMVKTETDTGLAGVMEFVRPKDMLRIGEAKLSSITYSFWRDQLYTVTIWTQNESNYKALRRAVFERFGEGSRGKTSIERYIWSDRLTDRMLEYIKESEYGLLWMRSRDLDRKLKLSKYDAPISYIEWLRSRDLKKKQKAESSSQLQEKMDSAEQNNHLRKASP